MNLTPLKAIRAKCLDCMAGSTHEVNACASGKCPLHPYRSGKNPNRKGVGGNPALKTKRGQLKLKKIRERKRA